MEQQQNFEELLCNLQ